MENRKKVTIRKNTCVKEPSGDYKIRHQPRGMTQAGDTIPRAQNLSLGNSWPGFHLPCREQLQVSVN